MYSIVGIDKKHTEKELVQPTYICKDSVQTEDPTYLGPVLVEQQPQCDREWDRNPKDSVQTEDPTYLGPVLVEQRPPCNCECDRNPTRQAIKSSPRARVACPPGRGGGVWGACRLEGHVSKIFTLLIFCSTYIHSNSIVQKTYREGIGISYIHT
jgi:hypothetical protein